MRIGRGDGVDIEGADAVGAMRWGRAQKMKATPEQAGGSEEAVKFSALGVPSLMQGRADHIVTESGDLGVVIKVYASGGENATHAHSTEDHVFYVLAGSAEFLLGKNATRTMKLEKFEGVYLPKGAYYRFTSTGEDNLVMLRVGSLVRAHAKGLKRSERVGMDGESFPGESPLNGPQVERVERAGAVFRG